MNSKKPALSVFTLLCAACVWHALSYYHLLPETVAHHFGASGQPDAWGSKTSFLAIYLFVVALMAAMFFAINLALPNIPYALINLPNKEFWLAPERRQQTMDSMIAAFFWFGSITLILLLDIFHQSFQVHLGKATGLEHAWLSLGLYLIVSLLWCVAAFAKFFTKDSAQNPTETR